MPYTLSYAKPTSHCVIVYPVWWKIWQRAKLKSIEHLECVVIHNVSQQTYDFLIKHGTQAVCEFVPNAIQIQLEQKQQPTSYIQTTRN